MRDHKQARLPLVAAVTIDDQVYTQVASAGDYGIAASKLHLQFNDAQRKDVGRSLERFVNSKCFRFSGGFYYLLKRRATPPEAAAPPAEAPPPAPVVPTSEPAVEPPEPGIVVCKKCGGTFPTERMYVFAGKPTSTCRNCISAVRSAENAKRKAAKQGCIASPPPAAKVTSVGDGQPIIVRSAGVMVEIPELGAGHLTIERVKELYAQLQLFLARVA